MPCPGPKEHQSQAHGSNSGTLKRHWMLGKWPEKSIFCMFSNFVHFFATSGPGNLWKLFSTWKCLPVDIFSTIFGDLEQILGLKLPHPTIGMAWKIIFFCLFQISSTFWVPNDQIWCRIYPQEGIFMCWVVFTGFQVYWLPKSGRNLKKCKNVDFQAICTVFKVTSKC